MKIGNTLFIPQNIAPNNAKALAIFDINGNKKATVPLGNLKQKDIGHKLYSSLLLSDVHTFSNRSYKDDSTANTDYIRALQFAQNNADFVCISGDLTCYGTPADLENYRTLTESNRGDTPVYAMAGNHEYWGRMTTPIYDLDIPNIIQNYTGFPLCYTITHEDNPIISKNDIFIFCGLAKEESNLLCSCFSDETVQWLYEQLESNRNKRCFLFMHTFITGSNFCGDAIEKYTGGDLFLSKHKKIFISLLSHYHNVIYFHGHSHELLNSQVYTEQLASPLPANYDYTLGCHSVHIPSLAIPYDISTGERVMISGKSEGYLMDVYENHIVLKGMDFVTMKPIDIAHYCLDTTPQIIEPNTFIDSTGTIK